MWLKCKMEFGGKCVGRRGGVRGREDEVSFIHPSPLLGRGELTFEDFLKSRGLTPNLVQFIIYSIASVSADVPFKEVSPLNTP